MTKRNFRKVNNPVAIKQKFPTMIRRQSVSNCFNVLEGDIAVPIDNNVTGKPVEIPQ